MCVLVLHSMPFNWTTKKVNLLIASYVFYAAWNPPFVVLLWVSTVVDWSAAGRYFVLHVRDDVLHPDISPASERVAQASDKLAVNVAILEWDQRETARLIQWANCLGASRRVMSPTSAVFGSHGILCGGT